MRCAKCYSLLTEYATKCSACGSLELVVVNNTEQLSIAERQKLNQMFGSGSDSAASSPFPKIDKHSNLQKTGRDVSRTIRLLAMLLDFVIAGLTLGIGWLIWFVIVMRNGQTPAKFLLKTRLAIESGSIPKSSITFWRYYLPNMFTWLLAPFGFLGFLSLPQSFALVIGLLQVVAWILPTSDALLIFLPQRKRGVDYLFKTRVVYL